MYILFLGGSCSIEGLKITSDLVFASFYSIVHISFWLYTNKIICFLWPIKPSWVLAHNLNASMMKPFMMCQWESSFSGRIFNLFQHPYEHLALHAGSQVVLYFYYKYYYDQKAQQAVNKQRGTSECEKRIMFTNFTPKGFYSCFSNPCTLTPLSIVNQPPWRPGVSVRTASVGSW